MLNSSSNLSYVDADTARVITLTGEGYFDVAHDESKPFRVYSGDVITTVLGTAFNINAYPDQAVTVTVTRGKVAVGNKEKIYQTLTPDQQLTIDTRTDAVKMQRVDAEQVTEWKKNYLVFDGITMQRAAELIGERFKVRVKIEDVGVKNCIVSAWFVNNETLEEVLAAIAGFRQAEIEREGDEITIKGGIVCQQEEGTDSI
jgi:ferric-dicitrate binding protein FerR (iron transport regulator)